MQGRLPAEDVAVLRCPVTHSDLELSAQGLVSADGRLYPVQDSIAQLLPGAAANDIVREFYEEVGWTPGEDGLYAETRAFVDNRAAPAAYTRRCLQRLGRYFANGGKYILDAGCGPIPYDELLTFSDRFERRVCLDLAMNGLQQASQKIGDKGLYLQGDITNIPLKDNSMDAITCNHVIYQLPDDEMQVKAFEELWRVLKPGGIAVVVFWFKDPPLISLLAKIAGKLGINNPDPAERAIEGPELPHAIRTVKWLEDRKWPFDYTYDSFRMLDNGFMRRHVPNGWAGSAFLWALYGLQCVAPAYCGRQGVIPAIIIRKPQ